MVAGVGEQSAMRTQRRSRPFVSDRRSANSRKGRRCESIGGYDIYEGDDGDIEAG